MRPEERDESMLDLYMRHFSFQVHFDSCLKGTPKPDINRTQCPEQRDGRTDNCCEHCDGASDSLSDHTYLSRRATAAEPDLPDYRSVSDAHLQHLELKWLRWGIGRVSGHPSGITASENTDFKR